MNIQFKPAIREGVFTLIALAGPSGGGKTYTALRLAMGLANGSGIAGIDTEACRMKHYADQFKFDHLELVSPFTPARYLECIIAAETAGYKVCIIDSASHEHAGEGGLLDFHEAELQRMAGDDYKRRESCAMAAWIKPKSEHKKFVNRLLQCKMHIIFCLRAEEKVKPIKDEETHKIKIMSIGWQPICEKNLPYEMTVSFLLTPDKPGFPQPLKLQEQHKPMFPLDKPISEESGKLLAAWAAGGAKVEPKSEAEAIERINSLKDLAGLQKAQNWWAEHYPDYAPVPQQMIGGALDKARARLTPAEAPLPEIARPGLPKLPAEVPAEVAEFVATLPGFITIGASTAACQKWIKEHAELPEHWKGYAVEQTKALQAELRAKK